ncbi:MAG TPA: phage holin family protein [Actinomycetaceae bacterium]|nr:phage holin family protein [Actinomycetaceae bacterium]
MSFLIRLIVNGVAIWLTSLLLDGIEMDLPGDTLQAIIFVGVIALVFTLVNMIIRPVVKVVSLPLLLLTLGLFSFVVNALMLMLTGWLSDQIGYGLTVDGFWWALGGSIVISIIATILNAALPDTRESDRRR